MTPYTREEATAIRDAIHGLIVACFMTHEGFQNVPVQSRSDDLLAALMGEKK